MKKAPAKKKPAVKIASKKTAPAKKPAKKAVVAETPVKKKQAASKKQASGSKRASSKPPIKPAAAKQNAVKGKTAKKLAVEKPAASKATPKKPAKNVVKKAVSSKQTAPKKPLAATPKKRIVSKSPVKPKVTKVTQAQVPVKKEAVRKTPLPKAPAAKQLTKADIQKFQKLLLNERDHLIASINNIEETSRTESGRDNGADLASFAETGTDSFNIETALNIASSESQRLRDVIDALDRIERGTYGICEGSGRLIPMKRLEAFPSARYCIEYQQEIEQEAAMEEFRY